MNPVLNLQSLIIEEAEVMVTALSCGSVYETGCLQDRAE
jgi:hypothetical protein